MHASFWNSVLIVAVAAAATFLTRVIPFAAFGKRKIPQTVDYLGRILPPGDHRHACRVLPAQCGFYLRISRRGGDNCGCGDLRGSTFGGAIPFFRSAEERLFI